MKKQLLSSLSKFCKKYVALNMIFVFNILLFTHQNGCAQTYFNIYTDAETRVKDKWVGNGTLTEQTGAGASEGTKDYIFSFTAVSWSAQFGLNLDNWGADPQLDVSGYQSLEISYKGPSVGDGIYLRLVDDLNAESAIVNVPLSASYSTVLIPLTDFGTFNLAKLKAINFGVTGTETGTGSFQLDNIRFSTAIATREINVKAESVSIASAGTYNFASVTSGSSGSAITFTIENTGNAALEISGTTKVVISGADQTMFTISQPSVSGSIAASGSNTFTITFSPTSTGAKSAIITITSNDSDEGTYTINLTGTATAAEPEIDVKAGSTSIPSSNTYNFASVASGSSGSAINFTIENTGTASLTIFGAPKVVISGTDQTMFTINQSALTSIIPAAGTGTFTITFSPTSVGSKSATITITTDDSDEGTYTIDLTGTATAATGIINTLPSDAYSIYPNPVASTLNISLDRIFGEVKLIVYDQMGIKVEQRQSTIISGSAEYELSLNDLPSGIYFVEIICPQGTITKKIIKQ